MKWSFQEQTGRVRIQRPSRDFQEINTTSKKKKKEAAVCVS